MVTLQKKGNTRLHENKNEVKMSKTKITIAASKNGKRMRNLFQLGHSMSQKNIHKIAGTHTATGLRTTATRRASTNCISLRAEIEAATMAHKSAKRRGSGDSITITTAIEAEIDTGGSDSMPFARRRRRRMRRKSLYELRNLASFAQATNKERMNLLEIALTPSEKRTKPQKSSLCEFIQNKLKDLDQPFCLLEREAIMELAASCTVVDVPAGSLLYQAQDIVDAFYLPLAGLVDVYLEGVGMIATIKRGRAFGLTGIAAVSTCTRKYSVRARETCHLLHISKDVYHNLKTLNTQIRDERYKRELAFLQSIPVFSHLDKTEIEQIMPLFKRCEFKKGKDIISVSHRRRANRFQRSTAGISDQFQYIYFLSQGECVVMINASKEALGERVDMLFDDRSGTQNAEANLYRLSKLHQKQCFGDISVLLERPEPANIRVSSLKAVLWRIHKLDLHKLGPSIVGMMKKNAIAKLKWREQETLRLRRTNRSSKDPASKEHDSTSKISKPQRAERNASPSMLHGSWPMNAKYRLTISIPKFKGSPSKTPMAPRSKIQMNKAELDTPQFKGSPSKTLRIPRSPTPRSKIKVNKDEPDTPQFKGSPSKTLQAPRSKIQMCKKEEEPSQEKIKAHKKQKETLKATHTRFPKNGRQRRASLGSKRPSRPRRPSLGFELIQEQTHPSMFIRCKNSPTSVSRARNIAMSDPMIQKALSPKATGALKQKKSESSRYFLPNSKWIRRIKT